MPHPTAPVSAAAPHTRRMHSATGPAGSLLLPGAGAVLRTVREGAPWPGTIVRHDDGRSALHVDTDLLEGTAVWHAAPDGHILAPIEVVRTASGHEAVFALCRGRLDHILRERCDAHAPPSAGECVTIAVSTLRGAAEAGAAACGQWWVTDEGRPVLALGGTAPVADASRDILTLMCAEAQDALAKALQRAAAALEAPSPEAFARAEDALFAAADPEPLVTALPAPALALSVSVTARAAEGPGGALRGAVERHIDAEIADQVAHAGDELRRRWQQHREHRMARRAARRSTRPVRARPVPAGAAASGRAGRLRPLLAGCVIAGTVLIGGLMWPSGDDSATTAEPTATPAPGSSDAGVPDTGMADGAAGPAAEPPPAAAPPGAGDLVAVAQALLAAAAACVDDGCLDAVRESPGRPVIDGVLALAPAERQVALVDDYGGVAVLRVSAEGIAPDRLMVIVDAGQKWLIRDAYDVADQP